jgi:sec-independent protein translocase protein TatB
VFNLQGSEIIVILLLALVVLGPEKLPDAVRRFMKTYNELRKMGQGFQSELKSALDEPMRELRDTANLIKEQADPTRLFEEASAQQRLEDAVPAGPTAEPDAPEDDTPAEPDAPVDAAIVVDHAPVDDEPVDPTATVEDPSAADPAGDDGPLGDLDPGSVTIGTPPPVPPVRPAGTVTPLHQPERLGDEAESA